MTEYLLWNWVTVEPSLQRKSPLETELSGISSSEKSLKKSLSLSLDVNSFYYVTSMRRQTLYKTNIQLHWTEPELEYTPL